MKWRTVTKSDKAEYKSFTKWIGLIGITNIITSLSQFIILPILTKSMSIENYGIWIQASVTISLLSSIFTLGLPYTMVRYMASEKNIKKIQENFYSIVYIVLVASSIVSLVIILFSKQLADLVFDGNIFITQILSIIIILACLNNIIINYFRTFHQIVKYCIMTLLSTYVGIIIEATLLFLGYGLNGVLIGLLTSQILVFLIMFIYIIKDIGVIVPKFINIKEFLSFGLPTVPGNVSSWIINVSDRYIIGIFLGIAYVGYYSPGYTLGGIINTIAAPIFFMLPSILSRYYDNNDMDNVKRVLYYSMKYFLIIAVPATIGITLLSRQILEFLTTEDIALNGYLITPFITVSMLLYGIRSINSQILILEKKTKITGFVWSLAAIVNLILNIIFIPYIGLIGAAISTLIAYAIAFIIIEYYSNKYIQLNKDWKLLAKVCIASVAMSLVLIAWQPVGLVNILLVVLVCVILYFIILFMLGTFKEYEINFFRELVLRK